MIVAGLWALLWVVAGLVGGALVLVLLALATPLHLALRAERGRTSRLVLRLRLFGGLTPWFAVADSTWPVAPTAGRVDGAAPPAAGSGWTLSPAASWRLMRELPGFLRTELGRIRIERLVLDADLGLGDPAETGRLFGVLMPLQYALPRTRARLDLRPDFARLRCEGVAEAVLRLIPLVLIVPALALAWRVARARP